MKRWFIAGIPMMLLLTFPCSGISQSSRCVILAKEGNRALVSCNGGRTRYIDIRGKTEIYNVGDSIEASDMDDRTPGKLPDRQK